MQYQRPLTLTRPTAGDGCGCHAPAVFGHDACFLSARCLSAIPPTPVMVCRYCRCRECPCECHALKIPA